MKDAPNLQSSPWPFQWALFSKSISSFYWGASAAPNTEFHMWLHQGWAEGKNHLHQSANNFLPSVAQEGVCLLCDMCLCWLMVTWVPGLFLPSSTPTSWPPACAGAWGYSCLGQDSGLPLAALAQFDITTLTMHWAKFGCWVWRVLRAWRAEMRYEWYFTRHRIHHPWAHNLQFSLSLSY